jgi:lipoprotein NlpI
LLAKARAAIQKKNTDEALTLLDKALERDPKHTDSLLLRAAVREARDEYDKAIVDLSRVLELQPKAAEVYNHRGSVRFKAGQIKESIEDFDHFLEFEPDQKPRHWQRGISLYYAGRFDEGRQQFDAYQTTDTKDVENAVWHFLCVARKDGVEKARASILKIGDDRRVPMRQIYDLFAGTAKAADVLETVEQGKPTPKELNARRFYAHLYLGLYAEVNGDKKVALEHLTKATDEYRIGHYMWDVARIGRNRLSESPTKK